MLGLPKYETPTDRIINGLNDIKKALSDMTDEIEDLYAEIKSTKEELRFLKAELKSKDITEMSDLKDQLRECMSFMRDCVLKFITIKEKTPEATPGSKAGLNKYLARKAANGGLPLP